MNKKNLDIGEVVEYSGLPASTLRYYEEKGLIHSIGRQGLRRIFDRSVLQKLSLISLGRIAGLSLDEIGGMFLTDGCTRINRQQLLDKADELEQSIIQLNAMVEGLRHVANCPETDHFECAKFNKMLRSANRKVRSKNLRAK